MTWWTEDASPGEDRVGRLCYVLREVLSRYDAPSCEIVVDGRRITITADDPTDRVIMSQTRAGDMKIDGPNEPVPVVADPSWRDALRGGRR